MAESGCLHIDAVETVTHPKRLECQECVKMAATSVHLRTCQECGGTHCCDVRPTVARPGTPTRRITRIASAEPGERWLYCDPDDVFAEY